LAITRQKKEEILGELKELLTGSVAVVAADNKGLTVEEVTQLRSVAREKGCSVKVAKNRLIKLALKEVGKPNFDDYLSGPTMLVTHDEDPISPAKVFADFAKDHEKLVLKGCLLREEVMDAAGVQRLSKLPGREELQSEFAGLVNTLVGVVYHNANNLFGEFAGLVSAQKDKLEAA
jgi:large subunit ribosomal protein L10